MGAPKARRFDLSPDNFIAGIAGQMTADELGLYWLICLLIYSNGGPVEYDEARFSLMLRNTHWRTIRKASEQLQKLGKITVRDGHVMAKGCSEPLQEAVNRVSRAIENGGKGGRPRREFNDLEKPDGFGGEKLARVAPSSPPSPPPEDKSSLRSDLDTSQAKVPTKRERRVLTALPDVCPTQADRDAAIAFWRDHGREDLCARLAVEAEAFRDHHAGQGTRMADWSAAWRTWRGNAMRFNKRPNNGARHPTHNGKGGNHAAHLEALADLAREDDGRSQSVSRPGELALADHSDGWS